MRQVGCLQSDTKDSPDVDQKACHGRISITESRKVEESMDKRIQAGTYTEACHQNVPLLQLRICIHRSHHFLIPQVWLLLDRHILHGRHQTSVTVALVRRVCKEENATNGRTLVEPGSVLTPHRHIIDNDTKDTRPSPTSNNT